MAPRSIPRGYFDFEVLANGSLLADDPDSFGGFAFVAEFTAEGKAKKASSWGSSPEVSGSAESVAITADGLVVTAGVVGPGPHQFGRASNSAKNAHTHLVIPTGVVEELPAMLEAQRGHILPFDSTSLGEMTRLRSGRSGTGVAVASVESEWLRIDCGYVLAFCTAHRPRIGGCDAQGGPYPSTAESGSITTAAGAATAAAD